MFLNFLRCFFFIRFYMLKRTFIFVWFYVYLEPLGQSLAPMMAPNKSWPGPGWLKSQGIIMVLGFVALFFVDSLLCVFCAAAYSFGFMCIQGRLCFPGLPWDRPGGGAMSPNTSSSAKTHSPQEPPGSLQASTGTAQGFPWSLPGSYLGMTNTIMLHSFIHQNT